MMLYFLESLLGIREQEASEEERGIDSIMRALKELPVPASALIDAFDALQRCKSLLDVCCTVREHGVRLTKIQIEGILPTPAPASASSSSSDARSVQVVFDPHHSRWEVSATSMDAGEESPPVQADAQRPANAA